MSGSDSQFYLSPNQQDLLVAALASNKPASQRRAVGNSINSKTSESGTDPDMSARQDAYSNSADGYFGPLPQESSSHAPPLPTDGIPYLGFDLDADGDDLYDFDELGQLAGDLPGDDSQLDANELHEKRKSIGDKDDDDEDGGGKRRESDTGPGKKPGRKPLTAEPTTVSFSLFSSFLAVLIPP
jgi:AP-1-like transcription factor